MPLKSVGHASAQLERTRDIEFLSLMAHDIRQPLSVIIGMAITLDQHWESLTEEQKRTYIKHISKSAEWMKTMIDDLLVAGASVNGLMGLAPSAFSLPDLIQETISSFAPDDSCRLVLATTASLPLGFGDPVKQRQVMQNLLDNALKYSKSSTMIHVGVTAHREMLAVTVADRGVGIASTDIPHLFDRYSRITEDSNHPDIEGSGLGLFVCKAMVNAQGGDIEVDNNTDGIGSIFTYTVPIAG